MPKSRSGGNGIGSGVSRRSFLKGVGTGVVSTAVIPGISAAKESIDSLASPAKGVTEARISLTVNGKKHRVNVESRMTLTQVLRDELELMGTKIGCDNGECGCCTVLLDGEPVYSCLTLAMDADGKNVTTIEGIAEDGKLSPVQQAFIDNDAYQCGYCTPGQILTATALLENGPHLSKNEIKKGMSGNLCRCSSYQNIFAAVQDAARKAGGR
ncbi:(2Fe-2S)-binding protein [candidate division KSB1 bacterium]